MKEKLKCELCKREFYDINPAHLKIIHNISLKDYIKLFPNSKLRQNDNPYQYWTEEEDRILKEKFNKENTKDLIKYFNNRTQQSIETRASVLNISNAFEKYSNSNKYYSFDNDFFSNININSAYWAGFIRGDGHLSNRSLVITLAEQDLCVLENIKEQIKYTGPIRYFKHENKNQQNAVILSINSAQKINKDLNDIWNIPVGDKRYSNSPPIKTFSKDIILAHIIGLIDADGSIFYSNYVSKYFNKKNKIKKEIKYKRLHINITGTLSIVSWCNETFYTILNKKYKENICRNSYSLDISGNNALKLIEELKKIPLKFRLSRKWDKPDYSKENPAFFKNNQ